MRKLKNEVISDNLAQISFLERPLRSQALAFESARAWRFWVIDYYGWDALENTARVLESEMSYHSIGKWFVGAFAILIFPGILIYEALENHLLPRRVPVWLRVICGHIGILISGFLLGLALALLGALFSLNFSAALASLGNALTFGQAFYSVYLVLGISFGVLGWLWLHSIGHIFMKRDFKRTITFRFQTATLEIESDFDRLEYAAAGAVYKPAVVEFDDIIGLEAAPATAFAPELAHIDKESAADSLSMARTYQVRLYDEDGESYTVLYDNSGADFARRFRVQFAHFIEKAEQIHAEKVSSKNILKARWFATRKRKRKAALTAPLPLEDQL